MDGHARRGGEGRDFNARSGRKDGEVKKRGEGKEIGASRHSKNKKINREGRKLCEYVY